MKKTLLLVTFLFIFVFLSSCSSANVGGTESVSFESNVASADIFAMNTFMTLTIYGEESDAAMEEAKQRIIDIEKLLSKTIPESEISRINEASGSAVTVSAETFSVLQVAAQYSGETNGAFDITIAPLMDLWGFTSGEHRVPSDDEIRQILPLIDPSAILLDPDAMTVCLEKPGMHIDLGGIAKGYTSNQVIEVIKKYKIDGAMLSLGGNVAVYGQKPSGDRWNIGIIDPAATDTTLGIIHLSEGSVITSGGYERFFEEAGKKYIHIMDPATGAPVESDLTSVSIVTADGTQGDCLSTALFVMGLDGAISYWREQQDFSFVLCDRDGVIYVSEDIADRFSLTVEDREIVTVKAEQENSLPVTSGSDGENSAA